MARTLTPQDAYALINAIASQAKAEVAIQATDTSSFISVGETLLHSGVDNTISALSLVIGKTLVAVRSYNAKLGLIQEESTGLYADRIRKISFYDKGAKPVGFVNTDINAQNLYNGADNNAHGTTPNSAVASMWEQDKPIAVEINFGGSSVWDFEMTIYPDQMKKAFRDEAEFVRFYEGLVTSKQNEIEMAKEAFNRATLLNYIAGLYDLEATVNKGMAVDLVAGFNAKFGTTYTGAELRSTYLKEFLAYMVSEIKKTSKYMTNRSALYHWSPSKTVDGVTYTNISRHTPMEDQRLVMLSSLIIDSEAHVLPEIFNPQYLSIKNAEMVDYWQDMQTPAQISITPAIPDTTDPTSQKAGSAVALPYVVAVLFDRDACLSNFEFDGVDVTPLEARKRYQNTWFHNMKNGINDFTENGVLFYMAS